MPPVSTPTVDVDARPDLVLELPARVVKDEHGRPRLVPDSLSRWRAVLNRMVGRPVLVSISREKERRSLEANRYLWGVVYERLLDEFRAIAQDAGERPVFANKDQIHDAMKFRFLGLDVVKVGDVEIERPATTTKLTPEEFSKFIRQIKEMAATRWQIYIEE